MHVTPQISGAQKYPLKSLLRSRRRGDANIIAELWDMAQKGN